MNKYPHVQYLSPHPTPNIKQLLKAAIFWSHHILYKKTTQHLQKTKTKDLECQNSILSQVPYAPIPSTDSSRVGFGYHRLFLEGIWSTREFQPIFNRNNCPPELCRYAGRYSSPPGAPAFRCSASLKRTPDKLEVETSEEGGFKVAWSYQKKHSLDEVSFTEV